MQVLLGADVAVADAFVEPLAKVELVAAFTRKSNSTILYCLKTEKNPDVVHTYLRKKSMESASIRMG